MFLLLQVLHVSWHPRLSYKVFKHLAALMIKLRGMGGINIQLDAVARGSYKSVKAIAWGIGMQRSCTDSFAAYNTFKHFGPEKLPW